VEVTTTHVVVEINLSSNDEVLGIRGKHHPAGGDQTSAAAQQLELERRFDAFEAAF
jgi:hypothetical protein